MNRAWWMVIAAGLVACEREDEPAPEVEDEGVLKDCAATEGNICPWAGAGGNGYNGEGKDKLDTFFSFPMSVTFSELGPPLIADWNNHKIRRVNDDGTIETIMGTFFLGDGDSALADLTAEGADGLDVNLNHPTMQQYLSDGTMLSASWHTHKLRTWDQDSGKVRVVLGRTPGFAPAEPAEDRGAPMGGANCRMNQPKAIEIDSADNVFILDMRNERIRFWDREADTIQTIAGNGEKSYCGEGDVLTTCFNFPKNSNPEPGGGMALSPDETTLYIADTENHIIRAIDLEAGTTSLIAGKPGEAGFADGAGADAQFNFPTDVELDGTTLFVADANNHRVRAVDLTTGAVSTYAGTGDPTCEGGQATTGAGDATFTVLPQVCDEQMRAGDGGPATEATLFRPYGVDLDLEGNLVIADAYNHRFRIVYR